MTIEIVIPRAIIPAISTQDLLGLTYCALIGFSLIFLMLGLSEKQRKNEITMSGIVLLVGSLLLLNANYGWIVFVWGAL